MIPIVPRMVCQLGSFVNGYRVVSFTGARSKKYLIQSTSACGAYKYVDHSTESADYRW